MIDFVNSHGFACRTVGKAVVVVIPWYDSAKGVAGEEQELCYTVEDVKIALGY